MAPPVANPIDQGEPGPGLEVLLVMLVTKVLVFVLAVAIVARLLDVEWLAAIARKWDDILFFIAVWLCLMGCYCGHAEWRKDGGVLPITAFGNVVMLFVYAAAQAILLGVPILAASALVVWIF